MPIFEILYSQQFLDFYITFVAVFVIIADMPIVAFVTVVTLMAIVTLVIFCEIAFSRLHLADCIIQIES